MPKTPTKKTAASTTVNQPYFHDANGDLMTQEVAIRHVEAGWYVVKKGRGFVLDKAGAMKFFTTTAAAMRAADSPAAVFGWAGMGYAVPRAPNVIEDAENEEEEDEKSGAK